MGVDIAMMLDDCPPWPIDEGRRRPDVAGPDAALGGERLARCAPPGPAPVRNRARIRARLRRSSRASGSVPEAVVEDVRCRRHRGARGAGLPRLRHRRRQRRRRTVSCGSGGRRDGSRHQLPEESSALPHGSGHALTTSLPRCHPRRRPLRLRSCRPATRAMGSAVHLGWRAIKIKNARFATRTIPRRSANAASGWPLARRYSRAFLHHLFRTKEITGRTCWRPLVNLRFYLDFMSAVARTCRIRIADGYR